MRYPSEWKMNSVGLLNKIMLFQILVVKVGCILVHGSKEIWKGIEFRTNICLFVHQRMPTVWYFSLDLANVSKHLSNDTDFRYIDKVLFWGKSTLLRICKNLPSIRVKNILLN